MVMDIGLEQEEKEMTVAPAVEQERNKGSVEPVSATLKIRRPFALIKSKRPKFFSF